MLALLPDEALLDTALLLDEPEEEMLELEEELELLDEDELEELELLLELEEELLELDEELELLEEDELLLWT